MHINKMLFVEELTKLSQKYGVFISGCGCCGSPYLVDDDYVNDLITSSIKSETIGDGILVYNITTNKYDYKESN